MQRAANYYFSQPAAGFYQLVRLVAGVETESHRTHFAPTRGDVIKLQMRGDQISLVVKMAATVADSSSTAAGKAGIGGADPNINIGAGWSAGDPVWSSSRVVAAR